MRDFVETYLPVVLSPQFWGAFATVAFQYLKAKGWVGQIEADSISALLAIVTTIGAGRKIAKSVGTGK